jgi:hypothetical protein
MPLSARQLTQVHRRQQLALRKVTLAEMVKLWPALDWRSLDSTYPALAGAVAEMVAKHRRHSAGLSAAYLRAYRVASGLDGDIRIVIPQVLNVDQFDATLHALSVAAVKTAASQAVAADVAMHNALTRSSGAMARLVLDAGRETVTQTIQTDDRATGWRRVLGGGGCDFCRKLAGRVYPRDNADFDAHGHCACTSEPVYRA